MTQQRPTDGWAEPKATALLVLADGTVLEGIGLGATGHAVGEVCFNTAMTGYEEILTDPSYAGQIITFTFPHIGNVGTNREDIESVNMAARPGACGVILHSAITNPSNYRSNEHLDAWLKALRNKRTDLLVLYGVEVFSPEAMEQKYGKPPARLQAQNLRHLADGMAFDLVEHQTVVPVRCSLVGGYNVSNLLAVVGALRALGIGLPDAARVVPQLSPVPGRMQRVGAPDAAQPVVVVDSSGGTQSAAKAAAESTMSWVRAARPPGERWMPSDISSWSGLDDRTTASQLVSPVQLAAT